MVNNSFFMIENFCKDIIILADTADLADFSYKFSSTNFSRELINQLRRCWTLRNLQLALASHLWNENVEE